MQLIYMVLGSVLGVSLLLSVMFGAPYRQYIAELDEADFPLHWLYTIGFYLNNLKIFSLRGKLRDKLVSQARLLYGNTYAEYYATVVWAQVLTFAQVPLAVGFLLAGLLKSGLFAFIGIAAAVLFDYYFLNRMGDQLKTRETSCMIELPEVVSTMALLINSGMILKKTWERIAYSKEGEIYDLMRTASIDMQNGVSEIDAIYQFGIRSNSPEIRKFASSVIQGLERGSRDLSDYLAQMSSEMWAMKKQLMLQKGEAASAKLLIPTAIIFVGIILVVLAAAIGMLI